MIFLQYFLATFLSVYAPVKVGNGGDAVWLWDHTQDVNELRAINKALHTKEM